MLKPDTIHEIGWLTGGSAEDGNAVAEYRDMRSVSAWALVHGPET